MARGRIWAGARLLLLRPNGPLLLDDRPAKLASLKIAQKVAYRLQAAHERDDRGDEGG
jgi:hypothetical protein